MKLEIYNKPDERAMKVRKDVFIKEQGFSYDSDSIDSKAYHIVLFENDTVIGTCRVFENDETNVYTLGRLAVVKEKRGKGYGKVLVKKAIEYVKELNGKSIILNSQEQAKGFYKTLGFEEYGEIEYEEACPHIWMKKSCL